MQQAAGWEGPHPPGFSTSLHKKHKTVSKARAAALADLNILMVRYFR
jgi:hypothetical protein